MNSKILFPELSYLITGVLFRVHNQVGYYGSEKQYADIVEFELKKADISFKREHVLTPLLEGEHSGHHKVDFLIEDSIILELKAKRIITREDYNQTQRYLRVANKKLGILVNFHNRYLAPKRVLNSQANV